jgi:hypothetical protein
VRLKNYRRLSTSVMTLSGRINYKRMSLIPLSLQDKQALKQLGINGYIYPLDEALGLSKLPFNMTIATMLEVARISSKGESFEDAEQDLKRYTDININDDTMRQITNVIGSIIFSNDCKIANNIWTKYNNNSLLPFKKEINHTLYLEIDGAMLPTRQKDNKGTVYKENKLGMAFSSDHFHKWIDCHGKDQRKITKKEYTSYIGDSEFFTKLMLALAVRNGYGRYKQTVLLSDGATWIRNLKDLVFLDAQQILDFYHLKEHISDYSKELFNFDESQHIPWTNNICHLFKYDSINLAIDTLKVPFKKKFKDKLDSLLLYLDNNSSNIDYKKYLEKGFYIGSGAIESSNKTVLHRRLKYGAMRWNLDSAQAVITLVAKSRSDLWDSDVTKAVYSHYEHDLPTPISLLL